jgi:hypothetical protein
MSVRQQEGDRVNALEELVGSEEPHATFHDAEVVAVVYNPVARTAALTAHICVGDPDAYSSAARERRRAGVLELRGVAHWRDDRGELHAPPPGVWLASDGPLAEAPGEVARQLARELQAGEVGWYFFFADSNSFVYWVAKEASFHWLPDGVPAV